jgi:hypothetical protein
VLIRQAKSQFELAREIASRSLAERRPLTAGERERFNALKTSGEGLMCRLDASEELEAVLAGMRREMEDGLARMSKAEGGPGAAQWYRSRFDEAASRLCLAVIDGGQPVLHTVQEAMRLAWVTQVWPCLASYRRRSLPRERGREGELAAIDAINARKRARSSEVSDRCRTIAARLVKPTAPEVARRYALKFPSDKTPSLKSIRRYLKPPARK